jgi:cell division protein FtsX
MPTARQLCLGIVAADVALFLVASALNDHSNTSVDGFVWWAALALFAVLIAIAVFILGNFLRMRVSTRRRNPDRVSWRSRQSG